MTGVYIHIPFCKQICSYCDFPKVLHTQEGMKVYLKSLKKEIKARYQKEKIDTIYFGGGTPTVLNDDAFLEMLKLIKIFKKNPDIEITIEANIGDLTEYKIRRLKEYGVNRISYGVQTFNEDFLSLFKRHHTYEQLIAEVNLLNQYGINNINFDLIYAIPNQTINDLKRDLDMMIKLKPTHISAYSLGIEPHTYLHYKGIKPISEDLDYAMYEYIRIYLKGRGYNQYEISNYSKSGLESKHNLLYWHNESYYGFGLGACSYIDNVRVTNTKSLTMYNNLEYIKDEEYLPLEQRMSYDMILGLRLRKGIDKETFFKKYNKNIKDVFDTSDLNETETNLVVPDEKVYIINTILEKFVL